MKKINFFLLSLFFFPFFASAQHIFSIKNGSKNYDALISIDTCDAEECLGFGTIKLLDKKSKKVVQTLTSENLSFYLDKNSQPTVNIVQLYNEQSPLIFDDFNFDGSEDLAIRNGNESGYGGPSYDVYVYNITKKKLVLSGELTKLATENLGMFGVDHKRKRLVTFSKSGCCWHQTVEYAVVPKKGLVMVYELIEDATVGNDEVLVTEKELVSKKWVVKKKKYKTEDYYKE
jgi:hypothetical protein